MNAIELIVVFYAFIFMFFLYQILFGNPHTFLYFCKTNIINRTADNNSQRETIPISTENL